jgi:hypothetical protein
MHDAQHNTACASKLFKILGTLQRCLRRVKQFFLSLKTSNCYSVSRDVIYKTTGIFSPYIFHSCLKSSQESISQDYSDKGYEFTAVLCFKCYVRLLKIHLDFLRLFF